MEQAKPKKPKLTVKQAKLVQGVVAGKTKRQAAKDAGYSGSPETLSVTASEVLKKPNVQEAFMAAMTRAGISADLLAETIANGLKAEKVAIIGNGEQAMADVQPDHNIRHKFLETSLKVSGVLNNKDAGDVINNFIYVAADDRKEFFDADS